MAKRRRRNPNIGNLTQGVDVMDAVAGLGGFAAAGIVPGMILKNEAMTTTDKVIKLAVSGGAAVVAGMVGKKALSPSAGKMIVAGGLIGVAAQALTMLTGISIGSNNSVRRLPVGAQRVNVPTTVSPGATRSDETVTLLTP